MPLASSRSRLSSASSCVRLSAAAAARSAALRTTSSFEGGGGSGLTSGGGFALPNSDSSGSRSTLYLSAASARSQNQLAFIIALRGTPFSMRNARSFRSGIAKSLSSWTVCLSCSIGGCFLLNMRSFERFSRSSATLCATLRGEGDSGWSACPIPGEWLGEDGNVPLVVDPDNRRYR